MSYVYEPQAVVDNLTAAGGHAMMKDAARLLTEVGLSRVQTSPGYDPDGPDSQAPTTYNTWSAPMVFALTGARQAAEPIFLVFRLGYGNVGAAGNTASLLRWYLHLTVCTAVSPAGVPGGVQVAMADMGGYGSAAYYAYSTGTWGGGHFAAYDGEGLTLILGRRALFAANTGNSGSRPENAWRSVVWLHLERRTSASGQALGGGSLLMDHNLFGGQNNGNPSYDARTLNNIGYNVSVARAYNILLRNVQGQNIAESVTAFERAGGADGLFDGTAPVVSPVYTNGDGGLLPLRRLFTIPKAAIPAEGGRVTLDFSGVEKDYLAAPTDMLHINMRNDLALLYEMG